MKIRTSHCISCRKQFTIKTSGKICLDCRKEWLLEQKRQHYYKNKDRYAKNNKRWYFFNKEQAYKKMKVWRNNNVDLRRALKLNWDNKQKEKINLGILDLIGTSYKYEQQYY